MDPYDRILNKLDKIEEKQDIQSTLLSNQTLRLDMYNAHLGEHMRRTDQNEAKIEQVEVRLAPLEEYIRFFSKAGKIITGVVVVLAGVATILRLFLK